MNDDKYIISVAGKIVKVFNPKTGNVYRTFTLPGDVINGPVQSGNTFTVILKVGSKQEGRIYKLPSCLLIKKFNA